jgi:hypothetical protein
VSKYIHIGDAKIAVDDYAIQGSAILGTKGSGKTYCGKGIAEQLLDNDVPIIIFDPIGRWRYMRAAGDDHDTPRGYKVVVAGGDDPDQPLNPANAQEIVRAAIRENIPLVLDLYERKLSKADWRRIVQTCFRTLLFENQGRRHVFLEETAEFAPQKVMDGETYAEVEKLVRMGGNVSLGITLINQRSQEVNKAVLELCDNLVLMKQRGSNAIDSIEKWVDRLSPDGAQKIAKALPHLQAGECFVFAGDAETPMLTKTGPIRSFHPNRRKPELTARAAAIRTTDTAEFVTRLQGILPKIVEEAKANDPAELRKRIAELTKMLKDKPGVAAADSKQIDDTFNRGYSDGWNRAVDTLKSEAATLVGNLRHNLDESLRLAQDAFDSRMTDLKRPEPAKQKTIVTFDKPPPKGKFTVTQRPKSNGHAIDSTIGGGKRRMLTVLAQYPEGMNHGKLSILTGLSSRSGTWSTYLGELRAKGYVDGRDHLKITEAGLQALGDYEPLPTGQELIDYWRRRLGESGKRKIFDVAISAYPGSVGTEEAAQQAGLSSRSGTWSTYLGELRTLGLITGRGELRASEVLFQ